jgi:hypothetical protein
MIKKPKQQQQQHQSLPDGVGPRSDGAQLFSPSSGGGDSGPADDILMDMKAEGLAESSSISGTAANLSRKKATPPQPKRLVIKPFKGQFSFTFKDF